MLAEIQPDQIQQWLAGGGLGVWLVFVLVGLLHCFFGYVLFRLSLLVQGAVLGWYLGSGALIGLIRATPSHADTVVAGLACAVLLALGAWFLYRLATGVYIGLVAGLVAGVAVATHSDSTALAWSAGIFGGVAIGTLVFVYVRPLVIILTALVGGLTVTGSFMNLIVGPEPPEGGLPWWGIALSLAAALVLTIAGAFFQQHTYRAISSRFAPEPQTKGRYSPKTNRPPLSKM
jgi:hypothetical protein